MTWRLSLAALTFGLVAVLLASATFARANGTNPAPAAASAAPVSQTTPAPLPAGEPLSGSRASRIAAGFGHTCFVSEAGGVKCWGMNFFGQLGNGATSGLWDVNIRPADVPGLESGVVAVTAGGLHSCALMASGRVKCWGINSRGQLGGTCVLQCTTPVDVCADAACLSPLSDVVDVQAGGAGFYFDPFGFSSDPFVPSLDLFKSHTCALTSAGAVLCWGDSSVGQAGTFPLPNQPLFTPVRVPGLPGPARAIAVGGYHTCALLSDGTVWCWGYDKYGQVSQLAGAACSLASPGTLCFSSVPQPVCQTYAAFQCIALRDVVGITAGAFHSCAVLASGGVKCWGYNGNGQLGDGTTRDSAAPVDVCRDYDAVALRCNDILSGISAVSGGGGGVLTQALGHTCALTRLGRLKCWGLNAAGKLGDGTTNNSTTPVDVCADYDAAARRCVRYLSGVLAFDVGFGHGCALRAGEQLLCWGANNWGQLGEQTVVVRAVPADVLDAPGGSPVRGVAAVSVGGEHTCAAFTQGGVRCWGFNLLGEAGVGDESTAYQITPVDVFGLGPGQPDAPGANGSCAHVHCLGAGDYHSCALTAAGGVRCWGSNISRQLGAPSSGTCGFTNTDCSARPVPVTGLTSGVASVDAGGLGYFTGSSCAVTTAGGVKCWGDNSSGQAGLAAFPPRVCESALFPTECAPEPADIPGAMQGVVSVSVGGRHVCALTTVGGVKCWGANDRGQLGPGLGVSCGLFPLPCSREAVDVRGLTSGVLAVAAGGTHTCVLTSAGGVKCWGDNYYGQLGDGRACGPTCASPVDVAGLTSAVVAIDAGQFHTCAVTTQGAVKCWGDNHDGQLGDAQLCGGTCASPVGVTGLDSGIIDVSAGGGIQGNHTCALTGEGGVKCWGSNHYGQLGDGTVGLSTTPLIVTLAGQPGRPDFGGDGGQAQDSSLNHPRGVFETTGAEAALYFVDSDNQRVRRIQPVEPTGTITTVAGGGSGHCGGAELNALGDGCPATDAALSAPSDVFVDASGDLYVADTGNCRVRRVHDGVITTAAGTGVCGYDGDGIAANSAQLNGPRGVFVDASDNIYIADTENCRVRRVVNGVIATVAGTGGCGFGGDSGPAASALLNRPYDVFGLLPSEDLVIADTGNHRVRRIDLPSGTISTLAGTGLAGFSGDDGPATSAQLNGPEAIAARDYLVLIADTQNERIRQVDVRSGTITTLVGRTELTAAAPLDKPGGVSIGSTVVVANTDEATLLTAGIDLTGEITVGFRPTHSCSVVPPGISSIDWTLPMILLGLIAGRHRLRTLFISLRAMPARMRPAG